MKFKTLLVSACLLQTMDGGGGGATGGGGAPSGGGGTGSGNPAPSGGGNAWGGNGGGSGAPSPVSLSDDTPINHGGKTMSWKEYRDSQYAPKSEVENARKATRQQIEGELRTLASRIKQQQQQNPQNRQPMADPLAQFRDMPLVAGKDMAAALEGTLGPVAQVIAGMQQKLQQQEAYLRKLGTGFGTLAKERGGKERNTRVAQAITSLGEGYDARDPFLQDVAQDVLDAWEFDKPEEFGQILGQRLKGMEEFIKRKQQADLKRAKARLFTRPGGGASPNGAARPDPRVAVKHAGDILFGPASQQRT